MMMNVYSTKDFYLSALLMSSSMDFVGSEKKSEGVYFQFQYTDKNELDKLLNDFVNYKAMVNMRKFTKSLARLRKELDQYKK